MSVFLFVAPLQPEKPRQTGASEHPDAAAAPAPAAAAALPQAAPALPTSPTLPDVAHILVKAGYAHAATICMRLCQRNYTDRRLLEQLVKFGYGKNRRTLLAQASACGHVDRARLLLDCGAEVAPAFRYASDESTARLLLERSVDKIPQEVLDGCLVDACARGRVGLAAACLDAGADPSTNTCPWNDAAASRPRFTPLQFAYA